jgi:uncharacterized RDD family membrane protein YckC
MSDPLSDRHPPPFDRAAAFEAALTDQVIGRRIAASVVDFLLCAILAGALILSSTILGILTLGLGFGLLILLPTVPVLYTWLFVAWMSATPGQRLFGIAVRRDEDLGPPGVPEALVWALGFALTLTLSFGLLWLLVVFLTPRHRALHDIVPGLVVVRAAALWGPPR